MKQDKKMKTYGASKLPLDRNTLNAHETAVALGISSRRLERMRERGSGPRWRLVGGQVHYDFADILEYREMLIAKIREWLRNV